ncbi:flagellar hook-associated protein FlgK [Jeongeupia naejangsanensis]|uniref:Flagellar hook-associated protein 1 n=1 Tax=Jeongeupia naejangsanensis TaxID=613195 RepID=A0ABS2BIK8_9NEIS|nr:flagellar hook-associated protein FlgK [Jeongeupia naejangsanensis]MBM3115270.1 flagellar hook-associated protein FlgK [Jeongeupia naejangsanensis]
MASSVFGIGVSGLNAANLGLTVTGHNIVNGGTPGYSRQNIVQSAPYPQLSGSGFIGLGVRVDEIRRSYDQFLTRNVQTAQAQSSYYNALLSHLSEVDNIVADPTAGVTPALQDFFSAIQNVATNPANAPSRQALLSSAQTLVNRFQVFDQRLTELRDNLNGELTNATSSINAISKQIAELNNQISVQGGSGHSPNDLLDQRDELVKQLNTFVKATATTQQDGSINVFIGNGQSLVVGNQPFELGVEASPGDPRRLSVVYKQNNNVVYLPENQLTGGKLQGLLDFRSKTLDTAQSSLNQIAMATTQAINTQQRAGIDLTGALGTGMFGFKTDPVSGAPALGSVLSNTGNTGNAQVTGYVADVGQLTASNYELAFDGTNYVVTRQSDKQKTVLTPAAMAAGPVVDGIKLSIASGSMNAGDRFNISPTDGFIRGLSVSMTDPNRVAAAGPVIASAPKTNTGSLTYTQPSVTVPVTDATWKPGATLQNPVTINFTSPTSFTITDPVTGLPGPAQTYTPGMTVSSNGWSMKLDGTPAAGDTVNIGPNTKGDADGRNALAMAALQTQKLMNKGSVSFQDAYGQMVSAIGVQTNDAKIMSDAQDTVLAQAEDARASVAGVNLDEEAANLLRYQQAYQAASKVIQIAQEAFQSILQIAN